jgi:hypothetical protein
MNAEKVYNAPDFPTKRPNEKILRAQETGVQSREVGSRTSGFLLSVVGRSDSKNWQVAQANMKRHFKPPSVV